MSNTYKYIVYDIGGTYIKWAVVDSLFNIIENDKFFFECSKRDCKKELINEIGIQVNQLTNKYQDIKAIGISTAGDVDFNTTTILGSTPNHFNYTGINFKQELNKYTKLDIVIDNDANCAVLGEKVKGLLQNSNSGILLTLGTDIGGGILINNQIFRGYNHSAGEVGYMNVNNRRWGTYFSATGLSRLAKEKLNIDEIPNKILDNPNNQYTEIVNYWYDGLSKGIANLIALFNPQTIIIGGGLSETNKIDLSILKTNIDKILIEDHLKNSYQLVLSKHGNISALYGCIQLLNNKYNVINN